MYDADKMTIKAGTPGIDLMDNAGMACADAITERFPAGKVSVLCGPGNNGGDGYVIARLLQGRGWNVSVFALGDPDNLAGDAALAAKAWKGSISPVGPDTLDDADVIVDALFGAGLSRDIDGALAELIDTVTARSIPVMAVDVPSGVDGASGHIRGTAFKAQLTVTFFRKKPGHVLMPGRQLCGDVVVADIGICDDVLETINPSAFENTPILWRDEFPLLASQGHKYTRGHAVAVSGGVTSTGAARLAADAALRVGAGLVTVASPASALIVNASHLTTIMLQRADDAAELATLLEDKRKNAVVIGPAAGVGTRTLDNVKAVLASGAATVLDADALTSFADTLDELVDSISQLRERDVVLTPHAGEFSRLYNALPESSESKIEQASALARHTGAVIVYKGPDTVIADPRGRCAVNTKAPPTLATAGSGDVLAGLVCGLMAQGMPGFEAACAGVWLHGAAANAFGLGLIASDIAPALPSVLKEYFTGHDL
ncbi:MAG: NAD(P)H-hydrate dehydratase [Hyphomicrobiales bacterium]